MACRKTLHIYFFHEREDFYAIDKYSIMRHGLFFAQFAGSLLV